MGKKTKTTSNNQNDSEISKNFTNYLQKIKMENKEMTELESITIERANELTVDKSGKCYLVFLNTPNPAAFKTRHEFLLKKFEDNFSAPVVLVPFRKRVNGNTYRRFQGTKVPRDRTLSAVFDSYLEDLLFPAIIVGKRIRFPQGKARQFKVIVDGVDKEKIDYKAESIIVCYKALTNRCLHIEYTEAKEGKKN